MACSPRYAGGRLSQTGQEIPNQKKGRVLVVDDEVMILEVLSQMLNRLDHTCLIAKTGKEALEIYGVNQSRIDLVILDMGLPDMDGGEVFERLKEMDPHVSVLISSGAYPNGKTKDILARGCKGFMQKPFDLHSLSHKIREILGQ